MILTGLLGLLAMLLGSGDPVRQPGPPVRMMVVQEQMILRIPVRPHPPVRLQWEEEKGPKCLPAGAIAWALLSGPGTIDIVMRNRQRIRAKLDNDCDGLDFYDGLYMQTGDGEVCAKRDSIRSRVGATCRIEKFRMLVPRIER
ncbi:hypothetical protein [Sphingomonas sp.]|uniref:hypothetical protein n=1 Tax=Sphingomonas sp. TaxID=28214 RepID=UPI002869ED8C|nr:hypothetical protein [Sphingomonas sp.]